MNKCSKCGKGFSATDLLTIFQKGSSTSSKVCESCYEELGIGTLRKMDIGKLDNSSFHGIPERLVGVGELISEKAENDGAISGNLFNGDFDVTAAIGRNSRLDQVIRIRTAHANPKWTDRGGRIV